MISQQGFSTLRVYHTNMELLGSERVKALLGSREGGAGSRKLGHNT